MNSTANQINCRERHIIHIVESFGSGCLVALSLICKHTDFNIKHTIIYSKRSETPIDFKKMFSNKVNFIHVPMYKSLNLKNFLVFLKLKNIFDKIGPCDVIHCHSSVAGILGRLIGKRQKCSVLYTPHSFAFLRTDIGYIKHKFFYFAELIMSKFTTAIVACGYDEYNWAIKLKSKNTDVICITNSLDFNEIEIIQNENGSNDEKIIIGTCGRCEEQHNPKMFIKIAKILNSESHWVWIGAKDDDILPNYIEKTGWLSRIESLKHINKLSIYVQMSQWEGLSFSILEAMALGKPVIVNDIPANRALIKHGETGFLVKNETEYLKYLKQLIKDAELRKQIGLSAKTYVKENHDAQKNYIEYSKIYNHYAINSINSSRNIIN